MTNQETFTKPNAMSTLSTWLYYLEHLHKQPIELGLTRIQAVVDKLELNRPAPYVITVAGTNGKGTTCRTLEMILIEAGYRVGVYSSPHLLRYTERVRVQNSELPEQQHVDAFVEIENNRADISLTYFEYSTIAALYLFKQAHLDIVILEVGLGGRLDATNVIDSDMAIITSIALDHTDWLGDNRESIGREKAGIIRGNRPVIVGEPDMPVSIGEAAKEKGALLYCVAPNDNCTWSYDRNLNNTWNFQTHCVRYQSLPVPKIPLANAATALAALSYSSLNVEESAIRSGLLNTALSGRMQIIQEQPILILDVAHNPHAAHYLNLELKKIKDTKALSGKIRLVIGMLKDKDINSTLKNLSADVWYCASLYGDRGASADQLIQYLPNQKTKKFEHVTDAWQSAMQEADINDIIVVCGSFHTVAEVMDKILNEK